MEGKEEEVGLTVEWGRKQGIVVRTEYERDGTSQTWAQMKEE